MAGRTNFVKVANLPVGYNNGQELFSTFAVCGQVQDITAVDPTTVIISFAMRSQAEYAEFALNNVVVGGQHLTVARYFPQQDPQYHSNLVLQSLGQYIGQDHIVFDPQTFRPFGQPAHSSGGASLLTNVGGYLSQAAGWTKSGSYGQNAQHNSYNGSGAGPSTSRAGPDLIADNTVPWKGKTSDGSDDECNICLCDNDNTSLTLVGCGHTYHAACLEGMIKATAKTYIECPTCKKVYGTKVGNMPTTGAIFHVLRRDIRLPGYENCDSIEITFNFSRGIQGPEHPNPGHPYHPHAFPRKAYLPDNKEGEMALHGVYMAWQHRIMFTVGQSVTSGMKDCITWNDIHMKTSPNGGEHGYPDPNYMKNLQDDLKVRGITEAAILEHLRKYPDLRTKGQL